MDDDQLLKAKILGTVGATTFPRTPDCRLNLRYAGATLDTAALQAAGWREIAHEESAGNCWYERLFDLPGDRLLELRICLNSVGRWRDAAVTVFDRHAEPRQVRTEAGDLPDEIAAVATATFDAATTEAPARDIRAELEIICGPFEPSEIPAGTTEERWLLTLWRHTLADLLARCRHRARRLISGVARHGRFCGSGETLALAAAAAADLEMRAEACALLRHALDETAENTAVYWHLAGCALHRLGLPGEAFECFARASAIEPGNADFAGSLWAAGSKLTHALLGRRDFAGLCHCAQVMLGCAQGIPAADKAAGLCALAIGYEGKGDLYEAGTCYSLARDSCEERPADDGAPAGEEAPAADGRCPLAVCGLNRIADTDLARRLEAFESQLACFPETPLEAGWGGRAPVTHVGAESHGAHWATLVEDVEAFLREHQRALFESEVSEGVASCPPAEIGFGGFSHSTCLELPLTPAASEAGVRAFLVGGRAPGDEAFTPAAVFPVFCSGGFAELTMNRAFEQPNGLEGAVRMLSAGHGALTLFVPDYYRDRRSFKRDFAYQVELAGFAYLMEPFAGAKSNAGPEGATFALIPQGKSGNDADHNFVGRAVEVASFDLAGRTVHRVVVDFDLDRPDGLRLPVFIGEHRLRGFSPQPGMILSGVLWLQGILRKEVGPSDLARRLGGPLPRHLPIAGLDGENKASLLDFLVRQALERLHAERVAPLPCAIAGEPQYAVRDGGRTYLLHLLVAEVASPEQRDARLAGDAPRLEAFARTRGVTVERASICLLGNGEGCEVHLSGFDELVQRYGRSAAGARETG